MGDILSFSLAGRTCRRHYWAGLLLLVFMGLVLNELETRLYDITISESLFYAATIGLTAAGLILTWLFVALLVRRFHDIDRTGWWTFSVFVPLFIPVGVLILGSLKGTEGRNRYGVLDEEPEVRKPAKPAGIHAGIRTPEETVKLLSELARLKATGAMTAEEYEEQKKRILSGC